MQTNPIYPKTTYVATDWMKTCLYIYIFYYIYILCFLTQKFAQKERFPLSVKSRPLFYCMQNYR